MKKILSLMLVAIMTFTMIPSSAFASNEAVDIGDNLHATLTVNADGKAKPSMCNSLFAEKADVTINGNIATIKMYVVFPIPTYPDQGSDGTLKDFVVTYNGQEYKGVSDIKTKPEMVIREDNKIFGLTKGEKVSSQIITVQLPKEALDADLLDAKARVNVIMNHVVAFDLVINTPKQPEPEKFFLEDGNHYVDFDLWHSVNDKASMGDIAFNEYSKALLTVKDGKVKKVQFATSPINMMGIKSAVTKILINGKASRVLEIGKVNTKNNKVLSYIKRGEFDYPLEANPKSKKDITYIPVSIVVPGTPMGERPIDARFRFNWSTTEMTSDVNISVKEDNIKPESPEKVKNINIKTDYGLIKVSFDKSNTAKSYRIAYRYIKNGKYSKWTYLNTKSNTVLIKNLEKGIGYDIRVATIGESSKSDYVKADRIYYTNRGGDRPAGMKAIKFEKAYTKNGDVKLIATEVKYKTAPQTVKYKFAYKAKGDKSWKYIKYSSSNIKTIKGLKKGKTYSFAVKYAYKSAVDNETYVYSNYSYKNINVK